jgi:glycosyltransferase involved in cell wall biosynthesis
MPIDRRGLAARVVIIYKTLPHYRRPFFELLRQRLNEAGVELDLLYGQPAPIDAAKRDTADIAWASKRRNRIFTVGSQDLLWQPCLDAVSRADLVIVEQASSLLVNHVIYLLARAGRTRLAFWGHGRNLKAHDASPTGEALKRFESRRVHWWFAYTESTAAIVRNLGFPESRITIVQNAIDTVTLRRQREAIDAQTLDALRRHLGIRGDQVCIFAGGMSREKRLSFLLDACRLIRQRVPTFEIVFLGAGPDQGLVRQAAQRDPWIHYVGPAFDEEKVPYFALARLSLMPGGVGLGVLDSFALGVPLVTTSSPAHGPEIEYLENGVNGVIIKETTDPTDYADAVAALLLQPSRLENLRKGCRLAADRYTIEEMVERFATGTLDALSAGNGTL